MFLSVALFAAMLCGAQELPYSKYLNFTKSDFKENHFKYHENTNTWFLTKTSCLDIIDVSSGNITKYLTSYGDYAIELKNRCGAMVERT